MLSAFTADAVYGSRRTSGHGGSLDHQRPPPAREVAIAGGRADGVASWGEPGGGVWTRVVQIEVAPAAKLRGLSSTDRGIGHGRAGCPERKEDPIRSFEVEGQECGYSIDVVR